MTETRNRNEEGAAVLDLDAIEARASRRNDVAAARTSIHEDVPALAAEIRRLWHNLDVAANLIEKAGHRGRSRAERPCRRAVPVARRNHS